MLREAALGSAPIAKVTREAKLAWKKGPEEHKKYMIVVGVGGHDPGARGRDTEGLSEYAEDLALD